MVAHWSIAKEDVMSCYDALPRNGGSIYFTDGGSPSAPIPLCKATDPQGCGIWVMGALDPNYSNPPPGWRHRKGAVNFVGVGGSCAFAFALTPQVCTSGGGRDANHPELWLSDVSAFSFSSIFLSGSHDPAYIGVDSTQSFTDINAASWDLKFDNVFFGVNPVVGAGPSILIASTSGWNFFNHCQFQGNGQEVATNSCLRTSGVTTCTGVALYPPKAIVLPTSWSGTMHLGVFGASDPSFDGIQSATITSSKTFTYSQPGLPNSSATRVLASSDAAQGMLVNPAGKRGLGNGMLKVENSFLAGSGIRVYIGENGGGIQAINPFQEDGSSPVVHIIGCLSGSDIENAYVSDSGMTAVWIDAPSSCLRPPYVLNSTVAGPAILAGNSAPMGSTSGVLTTTSPAALGQQGIAGNRVFSQVDGARRGFGPVAARFVNLAKTLPANWITTRGCATPTSITTADPSGGSNAGTYSGGSGLLYACFYVNTAITVSAGDAFAFGSWVRSDRANGFQNSVPVEISSNGAAIKFQRGGGMVFAQPGIAGGGEWDWVWALANVTVGGTGTLSFFGLGGPSHPTDFFAPVLVYIPFGTMTANELAEFALHLQTYRSDAKAGQVSLLPGEQFKADSIQVGDGPIITSGLGPPKGSASPGSIYLRRDGARGATFYIYEKDGWKAQF